jgi:hypothetical protein
VDTKDRTPEEQIDDALDHLEEHLIKYLNPKWKGEKNRKSQNQRKYYCKVPSCTH